MNADQVPLVSLSEFRSKTKTERWIALKRIVGAINDYSVPELQTSIETIESLDTPRTYTYLTWDDVIECLLTASEKPEMVAESQCEKSRVEEAADRCVSQIKVVVLKDGSTLVDMSDITPPLTSLHSVLTQAVVSFNSIRALSLS